MKRISINPIEGVSAYSLSKMVAEIRHITGIDKAVLRAMVDHYPNVWPDIDTLAHESGWSSAPVRRSARSLEKQNWVNSVGDKRGGTGNSEQYIVNDRKILNAYAMQKLEDGIEAGRVPVSNPIPEIPLLKEPNPSDCHNPIAQTQTQSLRHSNPIPTIGEPTIEVTKNRPSNLPTVDWAGRMQALCGKSGVTIPSGIRGRGKNADAILARINADGRPLVEQAWKLILERNFSGLTRTTVMNIFLTEYDEWKAKAESQQPEIDLVAFKTTIDRRNEIERNEIMNRKPERVLSEEDVFGS